MQGLARQVVGTLVFAGFCLGLQSMASQNAALQNFDVGEKRYRMFTLELFRDDPQHKYVKLQRDGHNSYLGCSLRWRTLTPLDHALLSQMAYFQAEGDETELAGLKSFLKFAFPLEHGYNVSVDEDWKTHPQRIKDLQGSAFTKYYKIDFHNLKHTVIAVQGTDPGDLRDVLSDLRLWLVSLLIDNLQRFNPMLNILTRGQRQDLQKTIDWVESHFTVEEPALDAHSPVVNYVHDLLHNPKNTRKYKTGYFAEEGTGDDRWTIAVTGHSLGGGISTIVGSTLSIPSISFSGPGFYYSKYQFGTKLKNGTYIYPHLARAMNLATTFIPSHDVVPRVDEHLGTIQHTTCSREAALSCHAISAMACDLLVQCGDDRKQTRFHGCSMEYELTFNEDEREKSLD